KEMSKCRIQGGAVFKHRDGRYQKRQTHCATYILRQTCEITTTEVVPLHERSFYAQRTGSTRHVRAAFRPSGIGVVPGLFPLAIAGVDQGGLPYPRRSRGRATRDATCAR